MFRNGELELALYGTARLFVKCVMEVATNMASSKPVNVENFPQLLDLLYSDYASWKALDKPRQKNIIIEGLVGLYNSYRRDFAEHQVMRLIANRINLYREKLLQMFGEGVIAEVDAIVAGMDENHIPQ